MAQYIEFVEAEQKTLEQRKYLARSTRIRYDEQEQIDIYRMMEDLYDHAVQAVIDAHDEYLEDEERYTFIGWQLVKSGVNEDHIVVCRVTVRDLETDDYHRFFVHIPVTLERK